MIDWTRVNELRDEIGAEDFQEVVDLFLSEVEERLETLRDEKSLAELEEDFHFLKGSALNLGFIEFASICQNGESRASNGEAGDGLDQVRTSYEASKTAFFYKLEREQAA